MLGEKELLSELLMEALGPEAEAEEDSEDDRLAEGPEAEALADSELEIDWLKLKEIEADSLWEIEGDSVGEIDGDKLALISSTVTCGVSVYVSMLVSSSLN